MSNPITYLHSLQKYFYYVEANKDMSHYHLSPLLTLLVKMELRSNYRKIPDEEKKKAYFLAYINCLIQDRSESMYKVDLDYLLTLVRQKDRRAIQLYEKLKEMHILLVDNKN